ncbi:type II toxin-antitoxin system RelE/ParE family toxin [Pinirhizobacter sp.]|uniref:type II toxin-antitoxin system RelE/ParE family toxin n=1 Tax=Pinirhizobacter sp. TaxID=2950432 RepID=UPI0039C91456
MNVSWSDDAEFQLTEIWRSIARDNPQAAGQLSRMIDDAVESIALFHHMGKPIAQRMDGSWAYPARKHSSKRWTPCLTRW